MEINGQARIKLSQDVSKVTMPGNKNVFRLYSADGHALIDLMQKQTEPAPAIGQKVLCRHPFQESKRAYVIPSRVESLYQVNLISSFRISQMFVNRQLIYGHLIAVVLERWSCMSTHPNTRRCS